MRRRQRAGRPALFAILVATCLGLACTRRAATPAPAADPATLRHPPAGLLVGATGLAGSQVWKGIPYAEPPVGSRRWRAPAPLGPWAATREDLAFGSSCVQFASPIGGDTSAKPGAVVGSEDCLTLNVWTPPFPSTDIPHGNARLPVMVWIHGGGNTLGTSRFYDGGRLAVAGRVVVVTVNYRLGAFGWFRQPALFADASAEERSGNFGTLDLIRALAWVHENISAFGGDPTRVTIFGESAGGANVLSLLVSPPARGLFQRAIVESGGTRGASVAEATNFDDDPEPGAPHSALEVTAELLVRDGTAHNRSEAKERLAHLPDATVADYLRGKAAAEILAAYSAGGLGMYELPRLILDGAVLPRNGIAAALGRPEATSRVPVVLGTNKDELKLFLFLDPRWVHRWFGVFPQVHDERAYLRAASYGSRAWKATGADLPAEALSALEPGQVYVYRFDWDEEPRVLWADLGQLLGAAHGFEIPFVFDHFALGPMGRGLFDAKNAPGREALASEMMGYWSAFAASGSPGRGRSGTLPEWRPWDGSRTDGDKTLLLDTPAGGGVRMSSVHESLRALAEEVASDASFRSAEARCTELARLVQRSGGRLGEADYRSAGEGACAAVPMAPPAGGQ